MSTVNYAHMPAGDDQRTFLGHPIGLFVLFFTELWERFNFYGMRALLIFYMTKVFLFDDEFGLLSYGAYNGLVYATPLLGGLLADRVLGYRRAIILGGILMAMGEFGLALSGFGLLPQNLTTFYISLGLIIVGNGFFKPNISTIVGSLYRPTDARRDSAFTIFYMGINIGAFLAPLICGPIGETYGFHYGFLFAGIGMIIGLMVFIVFKKHLKDKGLPPKTSWNDHGAKSFTFAEILVYIGAVLLVPFAAYLVQKPDVVVSYAAPVTGGVFLAYIIWEAIRSTSVDRQGILVVLLLTGFSIIFWAAFEQAGGSINLFTDRHIDRTVFGTEIKASAFQSVNAIFIVLLAPIFSFLWVVLGRRGINPSSALKFVLALIQVGLGFIFLVWAAKQADGEAKAGLSLLLICYFIHTTGELCLSPVGLSMVTKMAPERLAGLLMGLWFLSATFAHLLAGWLGSKVPVWGFETLFFRIMLGGVAAGVILFLIYPIIKKWERNRLDSQVAQQAADDAAAKG